MTHSTVELSACQLEAICCLQALLKGNSLPSAANAQDLVRRLLSLHRVRKISAIFGEIRSQLRSQVGAHSYPETDEYREVVCIISLSERENLRVDISMRVMMVSAGTARPVEELDTWQAYAITFLPTDEQRSWFEGLPEVLQNDGWPQHRLICWR